MSIFDCFTLKQDKESGVLILYVADENGIPSDIKDLDYLRKTVEEMVKENGFSTRDFDIKYNNVFLYRKLRN